MVGVGGLGQGAGLGVDEVELVAGVLESQVGLMAVSPGNELAAGAAGLGQLTGGWAGFGAVFIGVTVVGAGIVGSGFGSGGTGLAGLKELSTFGAFNGRTSLKTGSNFLTGGSMDLAAGLMSLSPMRLVRN